MTKKLTAVGLGPGDPNLITVKGLDAIRAARYIFVPRSQDGGDSLALRIAAPWLDKTRQQVVDLALPMTKHSDKLIPAWQGAASVIADHLTSEATQGVYLLLGDPLLYGTFTYIWRELAQQSPDIAVDIIPGVTSFAAAAAQGQFPLGATDDRVVILPASYETDAAHLHRLLSDFDTIILMKVGRVFPQIVAALDSLGLLPTTLYAERVGMPEESIVLGSHLQNIDQPRPYLSLLIVRKPHDS